MTKSLLDIWLRGVRASRNKALECKRDRADGSHQVEHSYVLGIASSKDDSSYDSMIPAVQGKSAGARDVMRYELETAIQRRRTRWKVKGCGAAGGCKEDNMRGRRG